MNDLDLLLAQWRQLSEAIKKVETAISFEISDAIENLARARVSMAAALDRFTSKRDEA